MRNFKVVVLAQFFLFFMMALSADAQLIDYNRLQKRKENKIQLRNQVPAVKQEVSAPATSPNNAYQEKKVTQSKEAVKAKVEMVEPKKISKREFDRIIKSNPRVKDRIERIYDLNRDGVLQQGEIIDMYKDVILSVNRRGSFVVSSDLLKGFDKDDDGQIGRAEASDIENIINL